MEQTSKNEALESVKLRVDQIIKNLCLTIEDLQSDKWRHIKHESKS